MQLFRIALRIMYCVHRYTCVKPWCYKYYAPTGLFKGYMKEISRLARNDNTFSIHASFDMLSAVEASLCILSLF